MRAARTTSLRISAALAPSPYEFFINLGDEYLIGASPEMFVRVNGSFIETCPIAGTIGRGQTVMEDAEQIRDLLNSKKDEAELNMCTDVDRNDKARICKEGSVRVVGRRMIEKYSKVFHTVDQVVGELKDDCDGFDALLSHMWVGDTYRRTQTGGHAEDRGIGKLGAALVRRLHRHAAL